MLPGVLINYYYCGFLLNRSVKNTMSYCKASTNNTNAKKQNTKEAKQKLNIWRKKQYKRSSGTKLLNPKTNG
jgi:hypothetical protein